MPRSGCRFAIPLRRACLWLWYLGDNSAWLRALERIGQTHAERGSDNGTRGLLASGSHAVSVGQRYQDFAYPMDSWQRSPQLTHKPTLCLRIRMPHGHGKDGENQRDSRLHEFDLEIQSTVTHHRVGRVGWRAGERALFKSQWPSPRPSCVIPMTQASGRTAMGSQRCQAR